MALSACDALLGLTRVLLEFSRLQLGRGALVRRPFQARLKGPRTSSLCMHRVPMAVRTRAHLARNGAYDREETALAVPRDARPLETNGLAVPRDARPLRTDALALRSMARRGRTLEHVLRGIQAIDASLASP